MENVKTYRDIKLVTNDTRRSYLLLETNCYVTKLFSESLLAIEINKTNVKIKKLMHLGM